MIPKSECLPGTVYSLKSRNLELGVWIGGKDGHFIGIRTKFYDRYLDSEYHTDNGPPFGTASPLKDLAVVPEGITLATHLGSVCGCCGAPVRFLGVGANDPACELNWKCDSGCRRAYGRLVANDALFSFLLGLETPDNDSAG